MTNRADELIDRRRLRRKLTFWRMLALIFVGLVIVGTTLWTLRDKGMGGNHIAKVRIEGTITEDEELLERLEQIGETDRVKGVIIWINSPGGTTTGGEAIYEAVRKLAEKKPVVTQVGTLAASAGYMIASASDHIVARQSSIVGSIGVLMQYPDISRLMDNIGVKLEGVKSSPLKASPSPFAPTTDEERAMIRALVMDSYDWFVSLVQERRPLSREEVLAVADGSIFTGRQALENRLVDELGGEEIVLEWLKTRGVDAELDIVEWKPAQQGGLLTPMSAAQAAGAFFGFDKFASELFGSAGVDRMFLDGLLSVWQPDRNSGNK